MTDTKALVERVREKARDLWAVAPSLASSESDRQTWADLNAALSELERELTRSRPDWKAYASEPYRTTWAVASERWETPNQEKRP